MTMTDFEPKSAPSKKMKKKKNLTLNPDHIEESTIEEEKAWARKDEDDKKWIVSSIEFAALLKNEDPEKIRRRLDVFDPTDNKMKQAKLNDLIKEALNKKRPGKKSKTA